MQEEGHRNEIVRSLVVCWKGVSQAIQGEGDKAGEGKQCEDCGEADGNTLGDVRKHIAVAGRLLVKAVEGEVDMQTTLAPLLAVDQELVEDVFGITGATRSKQ
jgi:hypothetical protein